MQSKTQQETHLSLSSLVCVCVHVDIQGWLLQTIPVRVLYAECMQQSLHDYVKKRTAQSPPVSASNARLENGRDK